SVRLEIVARSRRQSWAMPSWPLVASICALLCVISRLPDRLLLASSRRVVSDRLLQLWYRLDDTKLVDLPRFAAMPAVRVADWLLGSPRRSLFFSIPASLALTTAMALVGRVVRLHLFPRYDLP